MKRSIWLWQLAGFAVTSFCGTILHFAYEWFGEAFWIAPFSGVNESTWEHMKLLFWPMLVFAILQSFYFKNRKDFWWVKTCGITLGLALIPLIFYAYNGVIGHSPDWINIAIFFISAAAAYSYEGVLFKKELRFPQKKIIPILILASVALLFVIFTFIPPEIGIFKDPLTGSFGI